LHFSRGFSRKTEHEKTRDGHTSAVQLTNRPESLVGIQVFFNQLLQTWRSGFNGNGRRVGSTCDQCINRFFIQNIGTQPIGKGKEKLTHPAPAHLPHDLAQTRLVQIENVIDNLKLANAVMLMQMGNFGQYMLGASVHKALAEHIMTITAQIGTTTRSEQRS